MAFKKKTPKEQPEAVNSVPVPGLVKVSVPDSNTTPNTTPDTTEPFPPFPVEEEATSVPNIGNVQSLLQPSLLTEAQKAALKEIEVLILREKELKIKINQAYGTFMITGNSKDIPTDEKIASTSKLATEIDQIRSQIHNLVIKAMVDLDMRGIRKQYPKYTHYERLMKAPMGITIDP
jgi:hypothetical protein